MGGIHENGGLGGFSCPGKEPCVSVCLFVSEVQEKITSPWKSGSQQSQCCPVTPDSHSLTPGTGAWPDLLSQSRKENSEQHFGCATEVAKLCHWGQGHHGRHAETTPLEGYHDVMKCHASQRVLPGWNFIRKRRVYSRQRHNAGVDTSWVSCNDGWEGGLSSLGGGTPGECPREKML